MKPSDQFRQNAYNCLHLAEKARDKPSSLRFRRMARAWRAIANEQDWLDGELAPVSNEGENNPNGVSGN